MKRKKEKKNPGQIGTFSLISALNRNQNITLFIPKLYKSK